MWPGLRSRCPCSGLACSSASGRTPGRFEPLRAPLVAVIHLPPSPVVSVAIAVTLAFQIASFVSQLVLVANSPSSALTLALRVSIDVALVPVAVWAFLGTLGIAAYGRCAVWVAWVAWSRWCFLGTFRASALRLNDVNACTSSSGAARSSRASFVHLAGSHAHSTPLALSVRVLVLLVRGLVWWLGLLLQVGGYDRARVPVLLVRGLVWWLGLLPQIGGYDRQVIVVYLVSARRVSSSPSPAASVTSFATPAPSSPCLLPVPSCSVPTLATRARIDVEVLS
ncbi:hypothetical protein HD554DRAFT_2252007 [Boletus coccyginus]|nr:hypothetical protein HD554DRAFT_2252007 [Boletus coccyginus]